MLQPLQPPPGYFFYGIPGNGKQQNEEPCSECEDGEVHQHVPGTIRVKRFSFWKILKRYYFIAFIIIAGLGLHQEMSNNFTYLYYTSKWHLDHPSLPEFFMAHVRNMGHMKDTIPELNADMSLKDFMTQHVTNYWPGVFRGLG